MVNHIYDSTTRATKCREYSDDVAWAISSHSSVASCPECLDIRTEELGRAMFERNVADYEYDKATIDKFWPEVKIFWIGEAQFVIDFLKLDG